MNVSGSYMSKLLTINTDTNIAVYSQFRKALPIISEMIV